jgi:hypothetical protein
VRTIGNDRWSIRVDETEAHGEGRVYITLRQGSKALVPSLDGARELVQLLDAILQVEEYRQPAVTEITEPTGEET